VGVVSMEIFDIFPTPIGKFLLDSEFTQKELAYVTNAEQRKNAGNRMSVDSYILDRPELSRIKEFANNCVGKYFSQVYAPVNTVKLRITQSWVNYTSGDEFHPQHMHTNSILSGVIYMQASLGLDSITFYKSEIPTWEIVQTESNRWNSDYWRCGVTPASILVFPSCTRHMVEDAAVGATRISIAFNTFMSGTIGDRERLNELTL
jgi:uncharacterized protein (TIGR02466 family)